MSNIPIRMSLDIVECTDCLENECPWMVPESIYKLDEVLNENDRVLEFGTGGSTLFFARRCHSILAYETGVDWFNKVSDAIEEKKIGNIWYNHVVFEDAICNTIKKGNMSDFTVFSVDTQGGYDRSRILNAFLEKGISPNLRIIVLDNYAHEGLFPLHYNKKVIDSDEWEEFTYDHERWAGDGTKLIIKKQQ